MSVVDQVFSEYYAAAETGMWGEKYLAKRFYKDDPVKGLIARLMECFDVAQGGLGSMVQKGLDALHHGLERKEALDSKAAFKRRFESVRKFWVANRATLMAEPYNIINGDDMFGLNTLMNVPREVGASAPVDHETYAMTKMGRSARGITAVSGYVGPYGSNERIYTVNWTRGARPYSAQRWAEAYLKEYGWTPPES